MHDWFAVLEAATQQRLTTLRSADQRRAELHRGEVATFTPVSPNRCSWLRQRGLLALIRQLLTWPEGGPTFTDNFTNTTTGLHRSP